MDTLKLAEIVAVIGETNLPSQRLAAKLGFLPGQLGTYYGQQLVLHPPPSCTRVPYSGASPWPTLISRLLPSAAGIHLLAAVREGLQSSRGLAPAVSAHP